MATGTVCCCWGCCGCCFVIFIFAFLALLKAFRRFLKKASKARRSNIEWGLRRRRLRIKGPLNWNIWARDCQIFVSIRANEIVKCKLVERLVHCLDTSKKSKRKLGDKTCSSTWGFKDRKLLNIENNRNSKQRLNTFFSTQHSFKNLL